MDRIIGLIFNFENVLEEEKCRKIFDYLLNKKAANNVEQKGMLPWREEDTIPYDKIDNLEIKQLVLAYKNKLTDIVSECYEQRVYPHFTDLVLWREGKSMGRHKDNGYSENNNCFSPRVYSSVTYLNDNFDGGETVVFDGKKEHAFKPKTGAVLIFTSDERCPHRVAKVHNGVRATLPIWFALEEKYREED